MADLEESILKKNIPGKYSTWKDSKEDKIRPFDDDEEGAYDYGDGKTTLSPKTQSTVPSGEQHNLIPQLRSSNRHYTGAKGVLADHKEAKELEKIIYVHEQKQREEAFRRATEGARLKPGEVSLSLASIERNKNMGRGEDCHNDSNSSDDDDDDDYLFENDDFLKNYQQMRLTELKNNALPIFGHVKELTQTVEFSNVIDDTDSRVYCIFHLFNNSIHSCNVLNQHLDVLAQKMDTCQFFKMEASIVKQNFDPIGFPCVLIYRGGNEVANLTPITSMFSHSTRSVQFTIDDVESVLKSYCGM
jgi:hypothetical protein